MDSMIPLQTGANAAADSGRHSPSLLIPIHQAILNTGNAVADSGRHSPLLGAPADSKLQDTPHMRNVSTDQGLTAKPRSPSQRVSRMSTFVFGDG